MSILNVMWSGGAPFASIHKVHQQILSQAASTSPVKTWLLQGCATDCGVNVAGAREWNLSSAQLKGRHSWRLTKTWMQAGFKKALLERQARKCGTLHSRSRQFRRALRHDGYDRE